MVMERTRPGGLIEEILRSELGQALENFLATRSKNSCILCEPGLRDQIKSKYRDCAATWLPLDGAMERGRIQGRNVFVVAGDRGVEQPLAQQARTAGAARALTFLDDVLPSLVTRANLFGEHAEPTRRYALVSIPRTGSTYLCALLANHGLGVPLEHIRDPAAQTVNGDPDNFDQLLAGLEKYGSRNGIFGTKLISHFLLAASNESVGVAAKLVDVLERRGYRLMYLHRNFIDCLVSNLIANKLGTWHIYDAEGASRLRSRSDAVEMDKPFVLKHFLDMAVQKIALDVARGGHPCMEIDYDELLKDADAVVERMAKDLQFDPVESESRAMPVPESTREQVQFYEPVKALLKKIVRENRAHLKGRIEERLSRLLDPQQEDYARERIEQSLAELDLQA